jgi:hypothetical protein
MTSKNAKFISCNTLDCLDANILKMLSGALKRLSVLYCKIFLFLFSPPPPLFSTQKIEWKSSAD